MSRIIKMVDEIKEYYNLNDTLLASDLGIMQQTIRGWRDGRQPTTPNYNKVKKMYEEIKQEAVDNSIVQRFEALEEKIEKQPYRIKFPDDIGDYYIMNEYGEVYSLEEFSTNYALCHYERGLTFKTVEEAEQYDKERILLFKLHKWAEEHNEGWTPNWEGNGVKWYVTYATDQNILKINWCICSRQLIKLPYFKTEDIAKQFIEEFGDEIKEVLC